VIDRGNYLIVNYLIVNYLINLNILMIWLLALLTISLSMNLIIKVGKSKNEALDSIVDQMDDVAVEGLSVDGFTSYFLVSPGKHTTFQGPKFATFLFFFVDLPSIL